MSTWRKNMMDQLTGQYRTGQYSNPLERIALALESIDRSLARACPPPLPDHETQLSTERDLYVVDSVQVERMRLDLAARGDLDPDSSAAWDLVRDVLEKAKA